MRRCLTLLLFLSCGAWAQNTFNLQAGYAGTGVVGFGKLRTFAFDRRFTEVTLGFVHPIHQWQHLRLNYTAELVPLAFLSDPAEHLRTQIIVAGQVPLAAAADFRVLQTARFTRTVSPVPNMANATHIDTVIPYRTAAYGGGGNPVGLDLHVVTHKRVQPFAVATAGLLLFTREEPIERASAFNFSFAFGGGLDFVLPDRRAFTLGYKMVHISNADLGTFNPGVNTNFIYAGYRFGGRR